MTQKSKILKSKILWIMTIIVTILMIIKFMSSGLSLIFIIPTPDKPALAWHPSGRFLAVAYSHTVEIWDVSKKEKTSEIKIPEGPNSLHFSPNGRLLAIGCWEKGTIVIVQFPDLKVINRWSGYEDGYEERIVALSFCHNGQWIVSGSYGGTLCLWNMRGKLLWRWENNEPIYSLSFSPKKNLLAVGDYTGLIWLWKIPEGKLLSVWRGHKEEVAALSFSPSGHLLASAAGGLWGGAQDNTIKLWKMQGRKVILVKQFHKMHFKGITGLSFSPDGRYCVSCSTAFDPRVKVWRMEDGKVIWEYPTLRQRLIYYGLAWLATYIWQLGYIVRSPISPFVGCSFSPDGRFLAAATYYHGVYVWRVKGLEAILLLSAPTSQSWQKAG